jgi:predicted amidohydrolase
LRVALGVLRVGVDSEANLREMIDLAHEAADVGADLVVFPEASITGLINNDDPTRDALLGQPVPGPATEAVSRVAGARHLWIAFGLLEQEASGLYDSAVLVDDTGEIRLVYRRINPQWHGSLASPLVYRQGTNVPVVQTPWGKTVILLCGDLFDDAVVAQARGLAPDWVLLPFARCFAGGGADQERWNREEMPAYAERVCRLGATTLMVNYLADDVTLPDDGSFGGAFVVGADGAILAQRPLGKPGLLVADLT